MDQTTIIEVLKRWNAWDRDIEAGIERGRYIDAIAPYLERKEILVLKGIRRSGKSTIMKQLMLALLERGVKKIQMLYLNLEDYSLANDLKPHLLDEILLAYREHTGNSEKVYFFMDEVQSIEGWERWVRTKYDLSEDIKFIVSGSNASLLSRELSTLLTGRNLSFRIMPLSYSEFLDFGRERDLAEYLRFGGFPEVVLEKSEEKKLLLLSQYFSDIIHKDIISRHGARNAKQLFEIARYFAGASGGKVSLNKLSKVFGLAKDTLSAYIGYMIDAYLFFEVTYFSHSSKIRHDVTKLPKLYASDNGLITAANAVFSQGRSFENAVLIRIVQEYSEVSYWSENRSEVDFIAGDLAINVTSSLNVPERESAGLRHFSEKHKSFTPLLIGPNGAEGTQPIEEFLKG